MKIGIVIASVRDNRKGIHIANWVYDQSRGYKSEFELIDLKDMHLPHFNEPKSPRVAEEYRYDTTKRWSSVVSSYDGFIFVTPEYNGFFPGSLKDAVDLLYHEWEDKPFGIVGYGGKGAEWASDHLTTLLKRFSMKKLGYIGIHKPNKAYPNNQEMDETFVKGDINKLFKAFDKEDS